MKRLICLFVFATIAFPVLAKEDWRGRVVDEKGEPVAYANVAVLSKTDSTVLCGVVTEEDGTFNIVTDETDGIMMVAMLGYKTVYLAPVDGAVITLTDDTQMLEGAVASDVMPKTKLTGEGLQTNVRGSVLENVGTANDVLSKTPGLIKGQNGLEVIGKGSPMVYINGRRVSDVSELDRLQSNEIQSVEVITNPGAQYDATVRAVVRLAPQKNALGACLGHFYIKMCQNCARKTSSPFLCQRNFEAQKAIWSEVFLSYLTVVFQSEQGYSFSSGFVFIFSGKKKKDTKTEISE